MVNECLTGTLNLDLAEYLENLKFERSVSLTFGIHLYA